MHIAGLVTHINSASINYITVLTYRASYVMQRSDNNQIYYNISLLNASIYVENGVAYKMCLMKQSSKPSVKKKDSRLHIVSILKILMKMGHSSEIENKAMSPW